MTGTTERIRGIVAAERIRVYLDARAETGTADEYIDIVPKGGPGVPLTRGDLAALLARADQLEGRKEVRGPNPRRYQPTDQERAYYAQYPTVGTWQFVLDEGVSLPTIHKRMRACGVEPRITGRHRAEAVYCGTIHGWRDMRFKDGALECRKAPNHPGRHRTLLGQEFG